MFVSFSAANCLLGLEFKSVLKVCKTSRRKWVIRSPTELRGSSVRAMLEREAGATSDAGRSPLDGIIMLTGVYIFLAGSLLLAFPSVFGLAVPNVTNPADGHAIASSLGVSNFWIRVGGILSQTFGVYYISESLLPYRRGFVLGTIIGRVYLCCAFFTMWLRTLSCPLIIPILGTLNLISASITAFNLAREASCFMPNFVTSPTGKKELPSLNTMRPVRNSNTQKHAEPNRVAVDSTYDSGRCIVAIPDNSLSISSIELDRHASRLALSLSDERVWVVDAESGSILADICHEGLKVLAAGFSDNGELWSSCVDNSANLCICYIYDGGDFSLKRKILLPRTEALSIEVAPRGDSVLLKKFHDGAMHLELRSLEELPKLRTEWSRKLGFDGVLSTRVLWSRDRTYLTAGVGASKKNAAVTVLSAQTGEVVFLAKTDSIPVSVDLDESNGRVVSGCLDRKIRVFDLNTEEKFCELDSGLLTGLTAAVRFSGDGGVVLSGCGTTMRLWVISKNGNTPSQKDSNRFVDLSSGGVTPRGSMRSIDLDKRTGTIAALFPGGVTIWKSRSK
ncbi:hypothetical protein NDN08_003740 [Rhodosorus marinus]|uniref:Anaphase-promoting complex subunit 4 WD40 domain-containing protein n=1 Tax=Rhodosorus marinus TaxID=101924 RepID=A0AAV8UXN5_9RHOD|nr:hypothetical protein NDN08_003740 [Rhodosorus marinus]